MKIVNTGIVQGKIDVVRHAYRWGCDWPASTADYCDIDAQVICEGDMFHVQINDEGTSSVHHRFMRIRGDILGAYVVAVCIQSGAQVFMIIDVDTLDNISDGYLYRIGITRDEALEETAVNLFLAKSKQVA